MEVKSGRVEEKSGRVEEWKGRVERKMAEGSLVTLQHSRDSQHKLISALLEMNSVAIHTHTY